MTIYGLKDLDHYRLQKDDVVVFHVADKQGEFVDLKYVVEETFLRIKWNIFDASSSVEFSNGMIFKILELDPYEFCSKHYGYTTYAGCWPYYKNCDSEAATNVVKALYTVIDTMNGEWLRVKGDCSIASASTPLRFITQGTTSCSNPYQESLSDMPIDKLKKISSQIKTIKEDNNSKLKKV